MAIRAYRDINQYFIVVKRHYGVKLAYTLKQGRISELESPDETIATHYVIQYLLMFDAHNLK